MICTDVCTMSAHACVCVCGCRCEFECASVCRRAPCVDACVRSCEHLQVQAHALLESTVEGTKLLLKSQTAVVPPATPSSPTTPHTPSNPGASFWPFGIPGQQAGTGHRSRAKDRPTARRGHGSRESPYVLRERCATVMCVRPATRESLGSAAQHCERRRRRPWWRRAAFADSKVETGKSDATYHMINSRKHTPLHVVYSAT